MRPRDEKEELEIFFRAAEKIGHGPRRPDGLFDEEHDEVLLELGADPSMIPVSNMHGNLPLLYAVENFTSGNASALGGLDLRMYVDSSSGERHSGKKGGRAVFAVRFGNGAGIDVFPGSGMGVHGGAIQAAMDEVTAQCARMWETPHCTTRKITHQISRPVWQFQTYKAVCEIESFKNDGAVIVARAQLLDLLGTPVCISVADLVSPWRLAVLQRLPSS